MSRIACVVGIAAFAVTGCGGSSPTTSPAPVPAGVAVEQLSVNPATVTGGQTSQGTLTLATAAPASGAVVSISSSHTAAAVPASVTVPAGNTTATFTITTQTVTSATDVTISATSAGVAKGATLKVMAPGPRLVSLTVDGSIRGGDTATGSVELDAPAPSGGVVVAISSDDTAARVPASVEIPAGALRATFAIPTRAGTQDVRIVITATFDGATLTATLIVRGPVLPPPPASGYLSYFGSPGEYLSQGRNELVGGSFAGVGSCAVGVLKVQVLTNQGHVWTIILAARRGGGLSNNTYTGAQVYGRQQPDRPGLLVQEDSRTCNDITDASFAISGLDIGPNGDIKKLEAHIQLRCDKSVPPTQLFLATLQVQNLPLGLQPEPCP